MTIVSLGLTGRTDTTGPVTRRNLPCPLNDCCLAHARRRRLIRRHLAPPIRPPRYLATPRRPTPASLAQHLQPRHHQIVPRTLNIVQITQNILPCQRPPLIGPTPTPHYTCLFPAKQHPFTSRITCPGHLTRAKNNHTHNVSRASCPR